MTRTVGIFVFDEVEVLDFAGPFEVFSTASRVKQRLEPDADEPFRVRTIGRNRRGVRVRGGLQIVPCDDFETHDPLDVLIVPGGIVTAELERRDTIAWIAEQENVRWVDEGSIITAAGISAGIEMSLHIVARLEGNDLALKTARQMEFNWKY